MKRKLYGAYIIVSLALLVAGVWWFHAAQVRAASPSDTFLLGNPLKLVTPDMVPPGGVAHYAIVLQNSSAISTVYNIVVGDALPESMLYSGNAGPAGGALWDIDTPGYITFTVYALDPQETVTLTFDAALASTVEPGTVITNVACISDGVTLTGTTPATFTVEQPPAVQIAAPASGALLRQEAGSIFTISGHAWNNFTDPPYLTAPTLLPLNSPDDDGTYYVSWTAVPLAENYVLEEAAPPDFSWGQPYPPLTAPTVKQLVSGKANGIYYYRVRAYSSQSGASRWSNVQAITVTKTNLQYSLASADRVPHSVVTLVADEIAVEVSVDNGTTWHSATVANTSVGWDWTYDWTVPEQITPAAYPVMARARYAAGGDFGPTDVITFTLFNGYPDFEITKQGSEVVFQNQNIFYILTVTNTGDIAATQLVITDVLPSGVEYVSSSNGSLQSDGVVKWTWPELAVDAHADFTLTVKATTVGSVKNSSYGVSSEGGYYALGVRSVSTVVKPYVTYFPLILKRWPPVPYPPNLSDIDNADGNDSYTLNWTYTAGQCFPTSYEVQEAANASFTLNLRTPCTPGANTSCALTGMAVGTYYYRVRGINSYGLGEWSAVKSVVVPQRGYDYNFNGSLEGWAVRRSDEPLTPSGNPVPQPVSRNNMLYTLMIGADDFAMISPMQAAPSVPYTILAVADIVDNETIDGVAYSPKDQMRYSIIFGANGGTPCPANENTPKNQGCFSHYYRLRVRWAVETQNNSLDWSLQRIDYHEGDNDQGHMTVLREGKVNTNGNDWNKWKIEVLNTTGDNIKVYHGWGEGLIASVRDTAYINEPYFGVQVISPNWGAVAVRWDWFKVEAK